MDRSVRFLSFGTEVVSLVLTLMFPGTSTMVTLLIILALNAVYLCTNKVKEGRKEKVVNVISNIAFAVDLIALLALLVLIVGSRITGMPPNYYILFVDTMAFIGGKSIEYAIFAIPYCIVVLFLEISNLIKSLLLRDLTWEEKAQRRVK